MAGHYEKNDPLSFSHQLSVVFPKTRPKLEGDFARQNLFAVLPKPTYIKLTTQNKLIVDKYVLTADTAKTYAGIFDREGQKSSIPWILGPLGIIPAIGAPISIATFTIDGINRLAGTRSVTASQLVVLMANGGAFINTWSIEKNSKHGELLVEMVFYNVMVGTENRMFGILSTKYALIVR